MATALPAAAAADRPKPIADAVAEREAHCKALGGEGIESDGFIRHLDLNGDKHDDYILDDGMYRCSKGPPGFCGSADAR